MIVIVIVIEIEIESGSGKKKRKETERSVRELGTGKEKVPSVQGIETVRGRLENENETERERENKSAKKLIPV